LPAGAGRAHDVVADDVWVNSTCPSVPISFEEWPAASKCANCRITMPQSLD